MPVKQITIDEPLVACQNQLGEGCVWDASTKLLHWVDIKRTQIHTLDPKTGNRSIDDYSGSFDTMITSLTLRKDQPGVSASALYIYLLKIDALCTLNSSLELTPLTLRPSQLQRLPRLPTRPR